MESKSYKLLLTFVAALAATFTLAACGGVAGGGIDGDPDDISGSPNPSPAPSPAPVIFTYGLDGSNAIISGLAANSGDPVDMVIPPTIDGYPVTGIGVTAFANEPTLKSVTIPASVTSIGSSAFRYCTALTSVTLSEGLISIGNEAFHYCTALAALNIPATVTTMELSTWESSPFYQCTALTILTVSPGSAAFSAVDGVLYSQDGSMLLYVAPGKAGTLTVPDGVTSIAARACKERAKVTALAFGPNPTIAVIAMQAFENSGLTSLVLPGTLRASSALGSFVFRGCASLVSVDTGDGLPYFGSQTFSSCSSLRTVRIGKNVSTFHEKAFEGCFALDAFTVDPLNTYLCSVDGAIYNKSKTSLKQFPAQRDASGHAFPATLTTLEGHAFADYVRSDLTIPATVTTISTYCFWYSDIVNFTWPSTSGSASLGASAFYNCKDLQSCSLSMTVPPTCGTNAFVGHPGTMRVKVPSASLAAYQAANGWSAYAGIIIAK